MRPDALAPVSCPPSPRRAASASAALLIASLLPGVALQADSLQTKDGRRITGEPLEESTTGWRIRTEQGDLWVGRGEVRTRRTSAQIRAELGAARATLTPGDDAGLLRLADAAEADGEAAAARALREEALQRRPDDAILRDRLGYVRDGDRWVAGAEWHAARGEADVGGVWIPAELAPILSVCEDFRASRLPRAGVAKAFRRLGEGGTALLARSAEDAAARLRKTLDPNGLRGRIEALQDRCRAERTAALALIWDTDAYHDGAAGAAARDEVRRRLQRALAWAGDPLSAWAEDESGVRRDLAWIDLLVAELDRPERDPDAAGRYRKLREELWAGAAAVIHPDSVPLAARVQPTAAADAQALKASAERLKDAQPEERRMWDRLTALRRALGLPVLEADPKLRAAALGHSREMVDRKYFSHTSPVGAHDSVGKRAVRAGFQGSLFGENIAQGSPLADPMFEALCESPGHLRNFCCERFRCVGIAAVESTWTIVFGGVRFR